MTEHDETETGAELEPAPVYADSFIPAGWDGKKCLIICAKPTIAYGWRGPKCPHCGRKTYLQKPGGDIVDRAHDAGERAAAAIWHALTFVFRRPEMAEETEYCDQCTDDIGPVCDDKGCLWGIFQEAADATRAGASS
jgi:hypothetical protein